MEIKVMQKVLEENTNRAMATIELLNKKKVTMLNLISSPGSGKTTLLEKTLEQLNGKYKFAVIEGDIETTRDAQRLQKFGIPLIVINTNGSCHLDSISIENALMELDLDNLDFIFVENVGNLVCPAEFDIGEDAKIALMSTPEGDDKPGKYPLLFREAKLIILNKMDILPYTNFNKDAFLDDVKKLNGEIPVIETSCTNGTGIDSWINWLEKQKK